MTLRAFAVILLPQDFDEPVYLQAAFDYADAIRHGDFQAVIDYQGASEHPALAKLIYSAAVLGLGNEATYVHVFYLSRVISAVFGVIAVVFLTITDPLAGGLLSSHTLAIKYTSQVYLEAIPHALTIASVLAFLRTSGKRRDKWFWLSSVTLGAGAAAKFTYIPVTVMVVLYLALFEKKISIRLMTCYGAAALVSFFALNVSLWHDPLNRLLEMAVFHVNYSQGVHVAEINYPWYQPFIWVFSSSPARWHPDVFFYFGFDGLIAVLAVAGIKREWAERRWLVIWLAFGMLFLLLWPTKWPQYALSITPAICLMSAGSIRVIFRWMAEQENYWGYLREMFPQPGRGFWWSLGAFILFIAIIYLSSAIKYTVGRVGWSHVNTQNSLLPSDSVYELLPDPNGEIIIATGKGAAIWTLPKNADIPEQWQIFDISNSGLPANEVLSLKRDVLGNLWFGTANGLARFDQKSWQVFHAESLKLQNDRINALAVGANGQIYAGTPSGVSVWDGMGWTAIPSLLNTHVFDLVLSADNLWVATLRGIFCYNLTNEVLTFYETTASANAVIVDSNGITWAATSNGLARLQSKEWVYYNAGNSGLPFNTVLTITEIKPGWFWVGASKSSQSGGVLASFDGQDWNIFKPDNSGSSGAEPLTIVLMENEILIGTRTKGIDIFKIGKEP